MNTTTWPGALLEAAESPAHCGLPTGVRPPASHLPDSPSPPAQARRPGILLSVLFAHLLTACDSGSGNSSATPVPDPLPQPPQPPVAAAIKHGHYRGLAVIDGQSHHAEAILTVDGAFRLFVGSPVGVDDGPASGAGLSGHLLNPEAAMQFSGHVALAGSEGSGSGLVIGEVCTAPGAGRFCGESAVAEASLEGLSYSHLTMLAGEIRTATSSGDETWLLDLTAWSLYYRSPAKTERIGSPFREKLAHFARSDDVVITFDGAGRMFFQGPATGCTGNGVFTPHLDGAFFVFDVELIIENCNADYDILNRRFTGLATETQDGFWSYDTWLAVFLSTPEAVESPLALTMYAALYDGDQ